MRVEPGGVSKGVSAGEVEEDGCRWGGGRRECGAEDVGAYVDRVVVYVEDWVVGGGFEGVGGCCFCCGWRGEGGLVSGGVWGMMWWRWIGGRRR